MRLIDADALNDELAQKQYSEQTMGILHSYYPQMRAIVANAPTIEAVPVVHGQWKMTVVPVCGEYNFQCSACKESFWRGYSYSDIAHYCPNCGAKMDGDGNG